MRDLRRQPLSVKTGYTIKMEKFYQLFQRTLADVSWGKEGASPEAIQAANEIITICRAAIGGFAAKKDFGSVNEVISCFGMCSMLVVDVASSAQPAPIKGEYLTYDIVYLPDEEEENVNKMLDQLLVQAASQAICRVLRMAAVWGDRYDEKMLAKEPITQRNMKEARAEK